MDCTVVWAEIDGFCDTIQESIQDYVPADNVNRFAWYEEQGGFEQCPS